MTADIFLYLAISFRQAGADTLLLHERADLIFPHAL